MEKKLRTVTVAVCVPNIRRAIIRQTSQCDSTPRMLVAEEVLRSFDVRDACTVVVTTGREDEAFSFQPYIADCCGFVRWKATELKVILSH